MWTSPSASKIGNIKRVASQFLPPSRYRILSSFVNSFFSTFLLQCPFDRELPLFREGVGSSVREDDMVRQVYAQRMKGGPQALRLLYVGGARGGVAARVVMREDDASRSVNDGQLRYANDIHRAGPRRSRRDALLDEDPIGTIQQDDPALLVVEVLEVGREKSHGIARGEDRRRGTRGRLAELLAELPKGGDLIGYARLHQRLLRKAKELTYGQVPGNGDFEGFKTFSFHRLRRVLGGTRGADRCKSRSAS